MHVILEVITFLAISIATCRGKFLRGIYLYSNCEYKCKSDANTRELHGKPEGKKHEVKRENSLNQRDYNEFSMLYYKFNFLGFNPPSH